MTQSDILALINEIQPAADYPATKMNKLLTDILAAAYGPLYVGGVPPSNTTDETFGYRPGSVGYDTLNKRYYICQSATAGNAVWILIPADSSYQVAAYTTTAQQVVCSVNTTVVKCSNDSVGGNLGCSLKLPANPYIGRTVLVYFDDSIIAFTVRDSSGTAVNGASSLTIPAGQQYTFTYSGTAWEIVGVNNTTAGTVSGVDVANTGGIVTTDTNKLTFLGTGATVADNGTGGTNITINPLAGVDVTRGATVVTAAQSIDFTNNFTVTADGTGADVAFVSRTTIKQNGTQLTGPGNTIGGFDFKGSMFSEVPVALNASIAEITLNGAKVLTMTGDVSPTASNDSSQGYSLGSVGRNTGNLLRTYICIGNAVGAAVWDRITEDNGFQLLGAIVNNGSDQINYNVSSLELKSASASITSYVSKAPLFAYTGKKIHIYSNLSIGTFRFKSPSLLTEYFTCNIPAFTGIVAVCTNGATQTWTRIG
jgi:hypothetical protein